MEYWVDGKFVRFWGRDKVWYCPERGVFVPKFATLLKEGDRIYIAGSFARKLLNPKRVFDATNVNDMLDMALSKMINVPWVRDNSVPFEVSL